MKQIMACLVVFAALLFGLQPVQAAGASFVQNVKPHVAWSKIQRGQATLIDVRSHGEWLQTGVPKTARLVTVHDPRGVMGFVNGVKKVVRGNLKKPIAVICRTGNRSAKAAQILIQAGFKTVYNVQYGLAGSGTKKGWVAKGLPMVSCDECIPEN